MTTSKSLFVRDATGLVREISTYRSFVFNILNSGPAFMLVFLVAAQGLFPDAYLPISSLLALIPSLVLAVVYAQMSTAMPRSGGDYVFVGRTLHPSLGFMVNAVMFLIQGSIVGVLAVWITTMDLGPTLNALSVMYGNPGLASVASVLVQPTNQLIAAVLVTVLLPIVMFFGLDLTFKVNSAFWTISLISLIAFIVGLFATSASQAMTNFSTLTGVQYSQYISAAQSAGAHFDYSFSDTFLAIVYTVLGVWGFTFSSYCGGEVRNPQKSQLIGMASAAAVYIGIMTVITFAVYSSLGHVFFASISYLALTGSSAYTLPSFPTLQYLAGLATNNPILEILLGIGFLTSLLAIIGTILPFVQIRMIFAWSFDFIIPKKFADVSSKYHVPTYAIVAIIVVNVIFDYLAIYTPFASYFTYNVTASLFVAGIVGLAALVFPRRRKELFAASPPLVNKMIGGIPIISILGFVQLVMGVSIAYASLLPAMVGPLNPFYISFVVALFVICFVFYWVAYAVQRKRGIPLDLVMKEIPPE